MSDHAAEIERYWRDTDESRASFREELADRARRGIDAEAQLEEVE